MSWSCNLMKDLFDNATGDISLQTEDKKRGRPGKRVTEENFYDVLRYFEKQSHIQARKEDEIKRISWKAPSEHQTQRYIDKQLAAVRVQISDVEGYYAKKEGDFLLDKASLDVLKSQIDSRLAGLRQSEQSLMEKNGLTLGEWPERLQAWVNEWVDDKDWKRCLNLAARRRADKKVRKKELSISSKVFDQLRVEKDMLQQDMTWDDFLTGMLRAYKASKG